MLIGERCSPVVTKLNAQGIALTLSSIFIDGMIPLPMYITKENFFKPENMVRSKCLDFQWSYIAVIAEHDAETNSTQALTIHLIKFFNNEKIFEYSQMLTKYATCIPSGWQILVNGHWFRVDMGFTSGVLNGRNNPKSNTLISVTRRGGITNFSSMLFTMYTITKMDYCKQVTLISIHFCYYNKHFTNTNHAFFFYVTLWSDYFSNIFNRLCDDVIQ